MNKGRGDRPRRCAINKGDLPDGIKVTNPVPTWGGDRAETVAEAELRIPPALRDRIISAEDLRLRALEAPGVEIGRAEALPLFHPKLPAQISPGVVTVLVIPRTDPVQPKAPRPDRLLLEAVCAHLPPRRVLTTELHVRGPVYVRGRARRRRRPPAQAGAPRHRALPLPPPGRLRGQGVAGPSRWRCWRS